MPGGRFINLQTGEPEFLQDSEFFTSVVKNKTHIPMDGEEYFFHTEDGKPILAVGNEAIPFIRKFAPVESMESKAARKEEALLEEAYGGIAGQAHEFVGGFASALTGGTSDVIERLGAESDIVQGIAAGPASGGITTKLSSKAERRKSIIEMAKRNKGYRTGGEITGYIASVALPGMKGKSNTFPGLVGNISSKTSAKVAGKGLLTRLGANTAAYGAEGALFGLQQAVSNIALNDDPLNAELIASELKSNMIFGAGFGGGLGAGGTLLNAGAKQLQKVVRGRNVARSTREIDPIIDDLIKESDATLDISYKTNVAFGNGLKAIDDSIMSFKQGIAASSFSGPAEGRMLRELEKLQHSMRNAFGSNIADDVAFKLEPAVLKKALDAPPSVARGIFSALDGVEKNFNKLYNNPKLDNIVKNKIGNTINELDLVFEKAGSNIRFSQNDALEVANSLGLKINKVPRPGGIADTYLKYWAARKVPELLRRNPNPAIKSELTKGLTQRIKEWSTSDKGIGQLAGVGLGTAAGGIPGALIGAMLGKQGLIPGAKLIASIAGKGFNTIKKGSKLALTASKPLYKQKIPIGTAIFSKAKFSPTEYNQKAPDIRAEAYRRAQEIMNSTMDKVKTESILRAKLRPVFNVNPNLGNQIMNHQLRKLDYLRLKVPAFMIMDGIGMQPKVMIDDGSLNDFANILSAAENPIEAILDGLASNSINMETVETVKALHPSIYSRIQQELIEHSMEIAELPYEKRMSLGMLWGVQTDPTLDPNFIAMMQSNHSPPQNGGTLPAPRSPGAVVKAEDEYTPGQRIMA
jgi:hypothetical protein